VSVFAYIMWPDHEDAFERRVKIETTKDTKSAKRRKTFL